MPQHPRASFHPFDRDELIHQEISPELSPTPYDNSVETGARNVRSDNFGEKLTKRCDGYGKISTKAVENPVNNGRF
jgi:hypothetical protein